MPFRRFPHLPLPPFHLLSYPLPGCTVIVVFPTPTPLQTCCLSCPRSCPWRSSAPCTLCCQASAPRHSRPSPGEFWLRPVPAWPLNCHASQPARPQHCCRPFGYESSREDETIRDVGSGWEEGIFPVARKGLSHLPTSLHTPNNTQTHIHTDYQFSYR